MEYEIRVRSEERGNLEHAKRLLTDLVDRQSAAGDHFLRAITKREGGTRLLIAVMKESSK